MPTGEKFGAIDSRDIKRGGHAEQQTIPLKHEEIVVERRPLAGAVDSGEQITQSGAQISQDEVRVPLYGEKIMTVPTEEVILRKKEVTDNQLRSENMQTGAFDARDTNRDGHVSMGEKLKTGSAFGDARDTNRDGHVSMGEKLKTGSAFGDARDTNRDGHVSLGEKLRTESAFGDARDTNHDGHLSMGEKLKSQNAYGDSRDTNLDGHVSTGEKLKGFAAGKSARG
jgi:uncharacterized protein (TIGR02271 family)